MPQRGQSLQEVRSQRIAARAQPGNERVTGPERSEEVASAAVASALYRLTPRQPIESKGESQV